MPAPQYLITGRILFLTPNKQCETTEDKSTEEDDSHALTNEHSESCLSESLTFHLNDDLDHAKHYQVLLL